MATGAARRAIPVPEVIRKRAAMHAGIHLIERLDFIVTQYLVQFGWFVQVWFDARNACRQVCRRGQLNAGPQGIPII